MVSKEIWKDVVLFGELTGYEVSNFGRVRERETKQFVNYYLSDKGYCRVALKKSLLPKTMKRRWMSVHDLVLMAFDPIDEETKRKFDLTCDHKDKVKIHNDIANLRWLTRSENSSESHKFGRIYKRGEESNRATYSREQIENVCSMLQNRELSIPTISEISGVSKDTIGKIKARKQWIDISSNYDIPLPKSNQNVKEYSEKEKEEIIKLLEVDMSMPTIEIMRQISLEKTNATRMLINRIRTKMKNS